MTIGLIGAGLLGSAIAERLHAAGQAVCGFDRDAGRRSVLEAYGEVCASAVEVAGRCDLILLSLPDADVVSQVIEEMGNELRTGSTVVDTSTGAPDVVTAVGERLAERGVTYIDATVAGSSEQLRRGEAVLLIGGPNAAVKLLEWLWNLLAVRWIAVGPCGHGARMKLVSNLVMGLNRAALAEGLALARAAGLDPELTLSVLREGNAYSRVLDLKGRKMIEGDFRPQARLSQHLKDVRLIERLAAEVGARTPLSAVHAELLESAIAHGHGDLDNSALILEFLDRGGAPDAAAES